MAIAQILFGILSLFLGYRLFCDVRSRSITSLAAGALLALLGVGILIADARSMGRAASAGHPGWQMKSKNTPQLRRAPISVERFI